MSAIRLFFPDDGEGFSVADVVDRYLAWLKARVDRGDYAQDAYTNIARELRRFARVYCIPVSECRQHDLTDWLERNPSWKSGHTKKRIIRGLVACFRWAADEELIDRCPYRSVKSVSAIPYKPRQPASHDDYVQLMRCGSAPLRRALFFLRRTGARTCEMRELRKADCFLGGDSPHIVLVKHKTARTGKARKIGLDTSTARFLGNLLKRCTDHVFLNCDGQPWTRRSFALHFRRHARRLGLPLAFSAYSLRHTYTVDAIESGTVTDHEIADQIGSSPAMIQKVYGSHTRDRERHLANVARKVKKGRRKG